MYLVKSQSAGISFNSTLFDTSYCPSSPFNGRRNPSSVSRYRSFRGPSRLPCSNRWQPTTKLHSPQSLELRSLGGPPRSTTNPHNWNSFVTDAFWDCAGCSLVAEFGLWLMCREVFHSPQKPCWLLFSGCDPLALNAIWRLTTESHSSALFEILPSSPVCVTSCEHSSAQKTDSNLMVSSGLRISVTLQHFLYLTTMCFHIDSDLTPFSTQPWV